MTPFTIEQQKIPEGIQISLQGDFVAGSTEEFLETVNQLPLRAGQKLAVVMDKVVFMDSSALGALLFLQTRLQQKGVWLYLERPSQQVEDLLERVNCLWLFRTPRRQVKDPVNERLEAISVVDDLVQKKVNLLTVLLSTVGEIAYGSDESDLCESLCNQLSSMLETAVILIYLKERGPAGARYRLFGQKLIGVKEFEPPQMVAVKELDTLLNGNESGRRILFSDKKSLPDSLNELMKTIKAKNVICAVLEGMTERQGWLLLAAENGDDLVIRDNLKSIDLFVRIAGLQLESLRSQGDIRLQAADIRRAYDQLVAAQSDVVQTRRMAHLGENVLRLTRRLNNLLVPMLGYTQLLLGNESVEPGTRKPLQRIESAIQSSRYLIGAMTGMPAPITLHTEPVRLEELVKELVEEYRRWSDCEIVYDVAGELPAIEVDVPQCDQAVRQLIQNAIDAVEERPDGRVEVLVRYRGGRVELEVSDNGEGIPGEFQQRIFEPLFTLRNAEKHAGLGLFVVRSIMEVHRGEVIVESILGHGARFLLRWPQTGGAKISEEGSELEEQQEPLAKRRARLVVVDDEPMCADLEYEILSPEHEVSVFYSGQEAVDYMAENDFDLVLTDLRMPSFSGVRVYEWVKKNRPGKEKSVVFVSGNAHEAEYKSLIETTGNLLIAKPFNLGTFRKLVREHLEKTRDPS